jgi:hypothetical protein
MPIDTRQPAAEPGLAMGVASTARRGGRRSIGIAAPAPGDLLPPGDLLVPAPSPAPASGTTPQRALASDALRLLRQVRDPARRPQRWSDQALARDIELIRRHLAPLRTRRALAASFGREAFHVAPPPPGPTASEPGPVRLAYAIRWLELGDGATRPPWATLLDAPGR